jgi:hypothetical protein
LIQGAIEREPKKNYLTLTKIFDGPAKRVVNAGPDHSKLLGSEQ